MQLQQNIPLAPYTTYKIGGPARYFVVAKTLNEFNEALTWAKEHKQKVFVLGGGSNLLIADQGFNGLVIKSELNHLEFKDSEVIVGAGVILAYLLNEGLAHNLVGLEFAAGIPGTVGGAIRGNAGTYGQAMSDVVKTIKYLDENYQVQEMDKNQAGFDYRHSIFKEKDYIILEATLQLSTGDVNQSRQLIKERLKYRQVNHPHEPSCGCVFKNINFSEVDIEDLKHRGLDIDQFAKHQKIPTGFLIEQLDLKGKQIGQAKISEQHANYIVNLGNAKAEDVIMLISLIKQKVRNKYNIQLQEEVQILL